MKPLQRFCTVWKDNPRARQRWIFLLLVVAVLAAAAASFCLGSSGLRLSQVLSALAGREQGAARSIVLYVRLPRTLAALLAGSALAVAGVIIQAVLGNPLAGPNIIGVNAGAGLLALLAAVLFPAAVGLIPFAAFLGALAASLLVYGLARRTGASRITLVLAGVAVSSMLSAGIDTIAAVYPEAVVGANGFMVGGLSGVTLSMLRLPGLYIVAAIVLACGFCYELDLLSLGDEVALSLGLSTRVYRFLLLMIASALAGAAVSFAGLLGFVGLIVPHAARFLVGSGSKALVPASALLGAAFVTFCDVLARLLFAPFELPVGIIMSFLGGPFFLWLLFRQRGGRMHD